MTKTRQAKRPQELTVGILLTSLYACLSIAYFMTADQLFRVKNLLNNGITFVVPLPYILLTAMFVYLYSRLLNKKIQVVAYPAAAMALVLPLVYFLTDMKIAMLKVNPFAGNRNIFGIYCSAYYLLASSMFALSVGLILRKLTKGLQARSDNSTEGGLIFHLPIFIYFSAIEIALLANGFILYPVLFLLIFMASLSFETISAVLKKLGIATERFLKNETAILCLIFVISFLIRYFWGLRVIGITGSNFIIASDDGVSYDSYATILSSGHLIPKADAFYLNGFGYWYFLGAIYKMFGAHNFKAMTLIQSLIGASVPVFTYFIGKDVFRSRLTALVAGFMAMLNMNLIFLSAVIGMEAIYIPFVFLAMSVTVHILANDKLNIKTAFLIGSLFGICNNIRPELLFFPFIMAVSVYFLLKNAVPGKKLITIALSIIAGFILFMSIQNVANHVMYGDGRIHTGIGASASFADASSGITENRTLNMIGFNPFSDLKLSIETFFKNPKAVTVLMATGSFKRSIVYFLKPNFGTFDALYLVNPGSTYLFKFALYVQFYEVLFLFIGLWFAFKNRANILSKTVLLAFIIYISSMYTLIWVRNARYRGVIMPVLILFFSYGVYMLYKKVMNVYSNRAADDEIQK